MLTNLENSVERIRVSTCFQSRKMRKSMTGCTKNLKNFSTASCIPTRLKDAHLLKSCEVGDLKSQELQGLKNT